MKSVLLDENALKIEKREHINKTDPTKQSPQIDFSGIDPLINNMNNYRVSAIDVSDEQLGNISKDLITPLTADEAIYLSNLHMISNNEPLRTDLSQLLLKNTIDRKKLTVIIAATILISLSVVIVIALNHFLFGNVNYHISLAEKYISTNRNDKALQEYNEAIKCDPSNVEAYISLAELYYSLGNIDTAIDVLRDGFKATGNEDIWQLYLTCIIDKLSNER